MAAWLVAAWWARREFLPYDVNNTDVGTWLFQAETFAAGRAWRATPEPREFFQQWQAVVRDRSFAYYPPLPALALSVPLALGLPPFLVPWLSSGLALALGYAWVRRLAGERAALFATVALAVSPFFVANGLSLLSHAFSLCLAFAFLAATERWRATGGRGWAVAAGALLAAVFASRPVNAMALALAWVPWGLAAVTGRFAGRPAGQPLRLPFPLDGGRSACPTVMLPCDGDAPPGGAGRRGAFPFLIPQLGLFSVGFAALFVPLLLYYRALAGRWTLSLFTDYWPRNRFGFGRGLGRGEPGHYFQTFADHDFSGFLANLRYSAAGLAEWWTGNAWLSWALVLVLAALAAGRLARGGRPSARHWAWPLLVWAGAHVLLYAFYFTPSTPTTGPRYLAELMPALALATGWGAARLACGGAGRRRLALAALAAAMAVPAIAVARFMDRNRKGIPARRAVESCVEEGARPPALVFLRSFWIGHPFPIFRNPPNLSAPVIFACDRGAEDRRLVERHPERDAFILALFPEGRGVRVELVPVYRASDRRWLRAPELVEAPFFVGGGFTPPVRLEGEAARRLFHPRPDEIQGQ